MRQILEDSTIIPISARMYTKAFVLRRQADTNALETGGVIRNLSGTLRFDNEPGRKQLSDRYFNMLP